MKRKHRKHKKIIHNHWKYKNLTIVACGIILALILSRFDAFHSFLTHLGGLGYVGAFFAGALFVSTFTVATGALILLILAETLHPLEIGLIAGLGAVVGDLTIFRFVKDNLTSEIEDIYNHFDKRHHLKKLFRSKYFNWTLPILGAIIIASPLPDEMGVSLMGLSKLSAFRFIILSYFLNSIGIFLVVTASTIILL